MKNIFYLTLISVYSLKCYSQIFFEHIDDCKINYKCVSYPLVGFNIQYGFDSDNNFENIFFLKDEILIGKIYYHPNLNIGEVRSYPESGLLIKKCRFFEDGIIESITFYNVINNNEYEFWFDNFTKNLFIFRTKISDNNTHEVYAILRNEIVKTIYFLNSNVVEETKYDLNGNEIIRK